MRRCCALVALLFLSSVAAAQGFGGRQLALCEAFFAQGNLGGARGACEAAVAAEPELAPALRLLARATALENRPGEAQEWLERARVAAPEEPENDLVAAEIALTRGEYGRARGLALGVLEGNRPDLHLRALRAAARGAGGEDRTEEEADLLSQALALEPGDAATRRALAESLLEREPTEAVALLASAPDRDTPGGLVALGRARWIAGDLTGAAAALERAVGEPGALRGEPGGYDRALGTLALAYYGAGRLAEGGGVLAQIAGRRDLLAEATGRLLPWLLAAIAVLGLHLVGESRVEPMSAPKLEEGPRAWTVGGAYGLLGLAVLAAAASAVLAGWTWYGNLLAAFTPVQSSVVRDVYLGVFAAVLALGSALAARRAGWSPREMLVGERRPGAALQGLLLGLGMLGLTLAYAVLARFLPEGWGGFYLDLTGSRASLVLPLLLLPLAELFYRAYARLPFERRYGRVLAYPMLALLYGLSLGSPLPLLAAAGFALLAVAGRARSAAPAVLAQWTYYAGLVVVLLALPATRAWF